MAVMISSVAPAVLRAVAALSGRPSVWRVGYTADDFETIFWVFTDTEDMKEVEALFRSVQEIEREPNAPHIRLHVVPPKAIAESALPPFEVIYSRA